MRTALFGRHLVASLIMLVVVTVALGFGYPLVITGLSQLFFHRQFNGSLVYRNGKLAGSELIEAGVGGTGASVGILLGEISPGGDGGGLYSILVLALLAVFVAGLMVGRTPEFLGKKIRATQRKLVGTYVLVIPVNVLSFASISLVISVGTASILNPGFHGLSEITYAYASVTNNNGSAFAGLAANTTWYNLTLGLDTAVRAHRAGPGRGRLAGRRAGARPHPGHAGHRRADVRRVPARRHRDRRRPDLLPHAHPGTDRGAHRRVTLREGRGRGSTARSG